MLKMRCPVCWTPYMSDPAYGVANVCSHCIAERGQVFDLVPDRETPLPLPGPVCECSCILGPYGEPVWITAIRQHGEIVVKDSAPTEREARRRVWAAYYEAADEMQAVAV